VISRRKVVAASIAAPVFLRTMSATAAQDGGTLKIAGISYDYTPTVVETFQAAHPELKVELAEGALTFEDGALQTVLQSGKGPDVINVSSGPGRVGMLAASGLILSLDDFYQRSGITASYQPEIIEQIRAQNADGQIYEIVEGLDVFQVYYWTDMFEDAGVQVPTTWDEFLAACAAIKDSGVPPFVLGARDNFQGGWLFGGIVQASAGRDLMTDVIYGGGSFNQPNVVRAAEMLKQLVDEDYINGLEAAALDGEQANAAFGQRQGSMKVAGQGYPISLANDGIDVSKLSTLLFPSRNEGQNPAPTAGLAHSWVVNATTENLAAVETWLEFVASDEYLQVATSKGGALVPARILPEGLTLAAPIQDAATKLAAGAGYNPSVYFPAAAKDAWYAATQMILTDQASPEEAIEGVQTAFDEVRAG
jgi:raffinose/stachyose/melibiose transport system substrate-binding protein